jgi:hypothetical protein
MLYVCWDLFVDETFFHEIIFECQYGNKFPWVKTTIYSMRMTTCEYIIVVVTFSREKVSMHIIFTWGYYVVDHVSFVKMRIITHSN